MTQMKSKHDFENRWFYRSETNVFGMPVPQNDLANANKATSRGPEGEEAETGEAMNHPKPRMRAPNNTKD